MRISDWSSDVCSSDLVGARRRVLALGLAEADQANIVARLEPRPDLQPGGACLAVDEYPRRHGLPRPLRRVSQKVQRTTQQPVRLPDIGGAERLCDLAAENYPRSHETST